VRKRKAVIAHAKSTTQNSTVASTDNAQTKIVIRKTKTENKIQVANGLTKIFNR